MRVAWLVMQTQTPLREIQATEIPCHCESV
jgi:hypothetical protein